jgi:hypothetical protein
MCFPARRLIRYKKVLSEETRPIRDAQKPSKGCIAPQIITHTIIKMPPDSLRHLSPPHRRVALFRFLLWILYFIYFARSLTAQEHILLSTLFIFFLFYCVHAVEHFSCERSFRERKYCIVCAHKTMTFRHMEKKPLFVRIVPLIG